MTLMGEGDAKLKPLVAIPGHTLLRERVIAEMWEGEKEVEIIKCF